MNEEIKEMRIPLTKNIFISNNRYEYHLCEFKPDKDGKEIKHVLQNSHYTSLNNLFNKFPDFFLKNFSAAQSIEDLKNDLKEIKKIIKNVNSKLNA